MTERWKVGGEKRGGLTDAKDEKGMQGVGGGTERTKESQATEAEREGGPEETAGFGTLALWHPGTGPSFWSVWAV